MSAVDGSGALAEAPSRNTRRFRNAVESVLIFLTTVVAALLAWQLTVVLFDLPVYMLPRPTEVLGRLLNDRELLWTHAVATGKIAFLALVVSGISGVLLGLLVGWFQTARGLLMPLIVAIQSMPKIALAPLFVAAFGFGTLPKLIIAILVTFFPITLAVVVGIDNISTKMLLLSRGMGLVRGSFIVKILLPAIAPYVVASLTVAATLSVAGAIVAEFVGAQEGLGYLLLLASGNRDVPLVFATILVTALLGVAFYVGATLAGRLLTNRLGAAYIKGTR
jgi:NitT/TauT family transport system permease protein